jgi:hypothetical protein
MPWDSWMEGGWKGGLGRIFNLFSAVSIVILYLSFIVVYRTFGVTPWFAGVTTVVGYCIIDLLEKNVIEDSEDGYRIPHLNISLHPRVRLFFVLFLLMLMGALGADALASLIAGVPSLLAGTLAPWVGSTIAVIFVYLDFWVSYSRKEGKPASPL